MEVILQVDDTQENNLLLIYPRWQNEYDRAIREPSCTKRWIRSYQKVDSVDRVREGEANTLSGPHTK